MSSRIRSHILEDESRIQFKLLLPPEWVIRDKEIDYGVDCEVEIFDRDGTPTGYVFWVQLKATDSKEQKQKQSFRITKSKLKQLNAYAVPVLFARYAAEERVFYIRWAKYVALTNSSKNTSTLNVHFTSADRWSPQSSEQIKNYLIKVKFVATGATQLPVKFLLETEIPNINVPLLYTLRTSLSHHPDILEITRNKEEAIVFAFLKDRLLQMSLMDQHGVSFDVRYELSQENITRLTALVFLGLMVIFAQQNKPEIVQKILRTSNVRNALTENPSILQYILPALLDSSYINENLKYILECLLESHNTDELALVTDFWILFAKGRSDDITKRAVLEFLLGLLQHAEQKSDSSKAIALNNVGLFYKEHNDYKTAFTYFNAARKADPNYLGRDYFWMDVGATCFESERYLFAVTEYKKSIDLKDDCPFKHAVYGDALFFTGSIEHAKVEFEHYLNNLGEQNSAAYFWYLKYICAATLLANGYPKYQKRNQFLAQDLSSSCKLPDITSEKLDEILKADILSAFAWFNIGVMKTSSSDSTEAFFAFLMCALLNQQDVETWVNCTLLSFNERELDYLLLFIANVAYFYCQEAYIDALAQHNNLTKNDPDGKLVALIDSLIDEPKAKPKEVRIIKNDGTFEKFIFN